MGDGRLGSRGGKKKRSKKNTIKAKFEGEGEVCCLRRQDGFSWGAFFTVCVVPAGLEDRTGRIGEEHSAQWDPG